MFHNNTVINGEMWFSHSFFINTVHLFPMDKYLVFLLYNQSKHYRFIFPNDARKTCYLSRSEKCPLKHLDILITSQSTFERKKSLSNNNKNNNITTTQLKQDSRSFRSISYKSLLMPFLVSGISQLIPCQFDF